LTWLDALRERFVSFSAARPGWVALQEAARLESEEERLPCSGELLHICCGGKRLNGSSHRAEVCLERGPRGMTVQKAGSVDIFEGAEKIEIMGRLPSFLWAYIDCARKMADDLKSSPTMGREATRDVARLLAVLDTAADQVGNEELKAQLTLHQEIIQAFHSGSVPSNKFVASFLVGLPRLEELAGQRRDASGEGLLDKVSLGDQLEKMEKIKAGRSADIVISVDILDDVRNYLSNEVMTEGISSVMVIDSAGTLIVCIGDKSDLDVISLAAVAAANFAATEQIARLIGERDFVLLFYKGHNESFHFSRVGDEYIIVTIFNNSLSLGLLRLKIAEVAQVLEKKLPKRQV
jgi:predicted regulator of Ras-like GTPase activity (Roadblock/LC7/MglB family)